MKQAIPSAASRKGQRAELLITFPCLAHDARNENPKPIRWRADGEEILRKINAARKQLGKPVLNSAH